MVKWEDVCRPKEFGGLGIGYLKERNSALLGKWLWRFFNEESNLWQSIICHKYGMDSNGWDSSRNISLSMSLLCRQIIRLYPLFIPHVWLIVGNGDRINFSNDIWLGDSSLSSVFPWLYRVSNQKKAVIVDILYLSLCGHS